jgi:hypothetical protein
MSSTPRSTQSHNNITENALKEQQIKYLLKECYNKIDDSYSNQIKYYSNRFLMSNIIELLKLLNAGCSKYIEHVFEGYEYSNINYERVLVGISGSRCDNIKCISDLYYGLHTENIDKTTMKEFLRQQLLKIKHMAENIKNIISEPPFKPIAVPTSSSNRYPLESQYVSRGNNLGKLRALPKTSQHPTHVGGKARKTQKIKVIFGKERCIYKKSGDQKEYIKYKRNLITVKEYKNIIKNK